MNAQRLIVALLLLLGTFGCNAEPQLQPASRSSWPLANGSTMPADIKVESATIIYCNGVRCRLLGVAEPDDSELREQALEFSRRWFSEIGNYIGIYNDSNPLQDEDGTCVVWIRGYDMHLSCLSTELVRAGLANVDYSSLTTYDFMVPGKPNDYQETWREQLDEAAVDQKNGGKPKVLFDWPPTQNESIDTAKES